MAYIAHFPNLIPLNLLDPETMKVFFAINRHVVFCQSSRKC